MLQDCICTPRLLLPVARDRMSLYLSSGGKITEHEQLGQFHSTHWTRGYQRVLSVGKHLLSAFTWGMRGAAGRPGPYFWPHPRRTSPPSSQSIHANHHKALFVRYWTSFVSNEPNPNNRHQRTMFVDPLRPFRPRTSSIFLRLFFGPISYLRSIWKGH